MIKQMKYFQAIVISQSFTKAAEQCFISQSAISQQLQALEQELGVKLIEREKRKITLTPAGEFFYKKSLSIVKDIDKLCADVKRMSYGENDELVIGYLQSYQGLELKQTIPKFSNKFPNVTIKFVNGTHEELYNFLRNGKADVVISDLRRNPSDQYINFYLTQNYLYAELPAINSLSQFQSLTAADLRDTSCILIAGKEQEGSEAIFYREYLGLKSDFIFAKTLEEAHLMVVSGRGYLLIDFGEPPKDRDMVKFIPFLNHGEHMYRQYYAFWRVDNDNKYIKDFAAILKMHF